MHSKPLFGGLRRLRLRMIDQPGELGFLESLRFQQAAGGAIEDGAPFSQQAE